MNVSLRVFVCTLFLGFTCGKCGRVLHTTEQVFRAAFYYARPFRMAIMCEKCKEENK